AATPQPPPSCGWCCRPTPPQPRCRCFPAHCRTPSGMTRSPRTPRARTRPMFSRLREIDKPLISVALALAAYGLATLYSAGQTDVPTAVATIWRRQLVWLALGGVGAALVFRASPRELVYPGVIMGIPFVLVMLQPDLGSAIVFVTILFAMLFWAGTKPQLLILLASPAIGLILAFSTIAWGAWIVLLFGLLLWWRSDVWEGLAVMMANVLMGVVAFPFWRHLAPYQQNRLLAFLNPEVDPRATGWHVIQSKVAVGSGGFLGEGFTLGSQKRLAFLPAQHTDFIFSVVGEELGFVGVVVALTLFLALLLVLLRIARRATDSYSSLCVFGIAGLLFTHIVENVGMTVNLLPVTGIPLTFFS